MTKQLGKISYLLDHSEKNILVHPRNPAPPLEIKWWPLNLDHVRLDYTSIPVSKAVFSKMARAQNVMFCWDESFSLQILAPLLQYTVLQWEFVEAAPPSGLWVCLMLSH